MADILRSALEARIPLRVKHVLIGGVALFSLGYCTGRPDVDVSEAVSRSHELISGGGTEAYETVPTNEIARSMHTDLTPYNPVNPDEAVRTARDKGSSVLLGNQITIADAMRYNYIAGFRGEDLIVKTAIDGKESNYHPGAVGDVNWNASGDVSIGTAQIYCQEIQGGVGCDGIRDWRQNFHPQANANHSYQLFLQSRDNSVHDNGLSNGRHNGFAPWRNNPEGVKAWIPEVNEVYAQLSEQYGSLE